MKARVDRAVQGHMLQILVASIAQDPAAVSAAWQKAAETGKSGGTVDTTVRLHADQPAFQLSAFQRHCSKLASKCRLHSCVGGTDRKDSGFVAKLSPGDLVPSNEVHIKLPPFKPELCQQLSAAAADGKVYLSLTLEGNGMEPGQPSAQTAACVRIQLEVVSASAAAGPVTAQPAASSASVPAAAAPMLAAASAAAMDHTAAPVPTAAAAPGPSQGAEGAAPGSARSMQTSEQRLEQLAGQLATMHIGMTTLQLSSQSHSSQLARQGSELRDVRRTVQLHQDHCAALQVLPVDDRLQICKSVDC